MVLAPIGPFTPFRSDYTSSVDSDMQRLFGLASQMAFKMQSLGLNPTAPPKKEDVGRLADEIEETNEQWRIMLTRFNLVDDFQALQLFKLTETHLGKTGVSFDMMHKSMAWQIASMKAFANDQPPPPITAELQELMAKQQAPGAAPPPGPPAFASQGVSAVPFLPEALGSDVVRAELDKLVADNKMLVKMGERYGSFDGGGKRIYIEQLEAVEERWNVFLGRFQLMGAINPEFVSQTEVYLKAMQMESEEEFRELLRKTRARMKEEADSM